MVALPRATTTESSFLIQRVDLSSVNLIKYTAQLVRHVVCYHRYPVEFRSSISNFSVSTVHANRLAHLGTRPSASRAAMKFGPRIYTGPALRVVLFIVIVIICFCYAEKYRKTVETNYLDTTSTPSAVELDQYWFSVRFYSVVAQYKSPNLKVGIAGLNDMISYQNNSTGNHREGSCVMQHLIPCTVLMLIFFRRYDHTKTWCHGLPLCIMRYMLQPCTAKRLFVVNSSVIRVINR